MDSKKHGHRRSHHFAVASECFLRVAADPSAGGCEKSANGYNALVCAWMAAVFTAMVHVSGVCPHTARRRKCPQASVTSVDCDL